MQMLARVVSVVALLFVSISAFAQGSRVVDSADGVPGTVTLTQAILDANSGACPSPCTISFDPGVFNVPRTISQAGMSIFANGVTIDGFAGGGTPNTAGPFAPDNAVRNVTIRPGTGCTVGCSAFGVANNVSNTTFRGLIIESFTTGTAINTSGTNTQIQGNWIRNNVNGIVINGQTMAAQLTGIGGAAPADRNIIGGNTTYGIQVGGIGTIINTDIDGNFIGTDPSGTTANPNGVGIRVQATSSGTRVGTVAGNLIAGNVSQGILINTGSTVVENNLIGTSTLGNSGQGILISGASGITIERNSFRSNSSDGVEVSGGSTGNVIRENVYEGNGALPISLLNFSALDEPTGNTDPGDGDGGGNGLQNYPVISNAYLNPVNNRLEVSFSLDSSSTSNATYIIELYKTRPATNPDEQQFVASQCFSGNNLALTTTFDATPFALGDQVFLTATGYVDTFACPSPALPGDGTSEISPPATVGLKPGVVTRTADDTNPGSLRRAILDANSGICLSDPDFPSSGCDIDFAIPTSDPGYNPATGAFIIQPATPLPPITRSDTYIDGSTQSSAFGDTNPLGPEIVINGALLASPNAVGLAISTAGANVDFVTIDHLVINGFADHGILVQGTGGFFVGGTAVFTSYIGTDEAGAVAVPNGNGITLGAFSDGAQIGLGTLPALVDGKLGEGVTNGIASPFVLGNLISGNNGTGVLLTSGTTFNSVSGNSIGVDGSGGPLPNSTGIHVAGITSDNFIGGSSSFSDENVVAFNTGAGILIDTTATFNGLVSNSVFQNGALGIDLGGDGVTPNDPGDADTGANNLQNTPVITSQNYDALADTMSVVGTLDAVPASDYVIQIFTSVTPDPSGHGEGQLMVAEVSVTTDAVGHADFTTSFPGSHRWITATAIFIGGSTPETSEFSAFINTAPVANPDSTSTLQDTAVTTDVIANDTDAENDPIIAVTPSSSDGTVTCSGTTCTFTPNAGFVGTATYTYTAQDAGFATTIGTVTVNVTAANLPPVANDDTATTPSGTPVTTNVLSNDSDPEAQPLTVTIVTSPSSGTVTCSGSSCTYTPASSSFVGTDSYVYQITDGGGLTDTATVTVTVTNQSPVAEDDEISVLPGASATVNVLANDHDPEGQPLMVSSVIQGSQGTATCSSSGVCTYTANAGASGSDVFGYILMDSLGGSTGGNVFVDFQSPVCPTAPLLLNPRDGATGVALSGNLQWSGDADSYEVFFGPIGQGCSMSHGTTTSTSFGYSGLDANSGYEWRVVGKRAGCPLRESECATFSTETTCNVAAPTPLAPLGGETVESPITFRWTAVDGATEYVVFAVVGGNDLELGRTPATSLSASLPNGSSSWYVVATGVEGCGALRSRTVSFAVCNAPQPPLAGVVGEATSGQTYAVIWDPVPNASRYEVIESTNPEFTGSQQFSTTDFSMPFTKENITAPTAFYYRVRAFSDCFQGFSATSETIRVVIVPVPEEFDPNPSANAPVGSETPIIIDVFIPGEGEQTFQYTARGDQPWMEVQPATGLLPPSGVTLQVIVDPDDLPNGTFTGTVILDLLPVQTGRLTTNGGGTTKSSTVSINLVTPVLPVSPGPPQANSLIIPAVGHLDGLDARWRSDVRIANTSNALMKYLVTFTPGNPQLGVKHTEIQVEPGATTALDDIVRAWYGVGSLGESSNGVLEVRPATNSNLTTNGEGDGGPDVSLATVISSRTYAQSANGTLGEFIPGIPFTRFVGLAAENNPVLNLQQIAQNALFRTNVGVVEASGQAASALLSVFNSAGDKLTDINVDLQPNEQKQLNALLAQHGIELSDGRIEVQVVGGSGRVTAYAAVIDNRTKDQLFVPASVLDQTTSSRYVMPGIADLNTGLALWRSDMHLFNSGTTAQDATLTFYPQNLDGEPLTASLTVNPGEVKVLNNVVQTVFGTSNVGGAVHIDTPQESSLIVSGRTYNQTANGTLGLFVPAVTPAQALGANDGALNLLQAEDSIRYRTNLGIAEVTGKPVTVEVTVILPGERVTPRFEVPLEANEFMQIPVLSGLRIGNVYNARISLRVVNGEGRIAAYGSVIDMKTNDSTYVPAQ